MTDSVHQPAHYTSDRFGCECIEITRHMTFTAGNAVKYVWRHAEKGGVEDLRKALVYLRWHVEDGYPMALSDAGHLSIIASMTDHVMPVLLDVDPVYGAIANITAGYTEIARNLIQYRIRELETL